MEKPDRLVAMWDDEELEWKQEADGFGFEFLNRMLVGDDSDYDEEGYDENDVVIPLYYKILKYGICESN
jgi:hypothetical protein